jgi:hypothetical protein
VKMKYLLALLSLALAGCTQKSESATPNADAARIAALESQLEDLKPGLGEIMSVIQQHHAKLYYAAKAQNWTLADYQLGEIREGLEDAAKFHPHFKTVKAPLNELIPAMTKPGLDEIDAAIKAQKKADFEKGFHNLTVSCNACHSAAEHPFIVVQIPSAAEFTNQKFLK